MRKLMAALLVVTVPGVAAGQSLGEAARKEAERRQKNKEAGVKAPAYSDADMPPPPAAEPATGAGSEGADHPSALPKPAEGGPSAAPVAGEGQLERSPADADAAERQAKERYWRDRKAKAVARRDETKRRYDALNELRLAPNERYVDEKGRTVIQDLEHLRELIAQAKAELDATEKALVDLEEEARRAGALPGWLR